MPRLDAELVHQGSASALIGIERLCLPAAAVEGEHQLRPQAFAERMLADKRLEIGGNLVISSEPEIGVESLLHRHET